MKYKIAFIISLMLYPLFNIYSQSISYSLSNVLRYGNGINNTTEGAITNGNKKKYFDYYTDAKIFYDNFYAGLRLEDVNPPEYGPVKQGITQRYLEYSSNHFDVRAGNSFSLFGRGLALNLFENRSLAFTTIMDGIKGQYINDFIQATILYGKINYIDASTAMDKNPHIEDYYLKAANLEIKPLVRLKIGGSFVYSENRYPNSIFINKTDTSFVHIWEAYLQFQSSSLDFFASYSYKTTDLVNNINSFGDGIYSSISYSGAGYGVTLEYKNYNFDPVDPIKRVNIYRPSRALPFQNPPTGIKEHSFTLFTRYPHIVDFNDELGFQLDAFYLMSKLMTVNFNCSISSRHNEYLFNPVAFSIEKVGKTSSILPSLSAGKSPFWEAYFDLKYYFPNSESFIVAAFDRRSDINYDPLNFVSPVQPQRITGIASQLYYLINGMWSIKATEEMQWYYEFPFTEKFFTNLFSFQVTYLQNYTLGFRFENTTNKYEQAGKTSWLVAEGSYRFNMSNIITISYGDERGGQICSNGICRQVLPYSGFRFSLLSNF